MKYVWYLFVIVASFKTTAVAQEHPEFEREVRSRPILKSLLGEFFVEGGNAFKMADINEEFSLLGDSEAVAMLELTKAQKEDVQQFNRKLSKLRTELRSYLAESQIIPVLERREFENAMKSKVDAMNIEFDALLTKEQKRRCIALQNRNKLIVLGLSRYLGQSELAQDSQTKEKLNRFFEKILTEYKNETKAFYSESLDQFVNALPESQRNFFTEGRLGWLKSKTPPWCVLQWQLEAFDEVKVGPETLLVEALNPPRFEFENAINLVAAQGAANEPWADKIVAVLAFKNVHIGFEEFQERRYLAGLAEPLEEFVRKQGELKAAFLAGEISKAEYVKRRNTLRLEHNKHRWDYLLQSVLLPEQKEATINLTKLHCISVRGVPSTLLNGFLSRELQLTPEIKTQIKKIASRELKTAKEIKTKFDTQFVDGLRNSLNRKEYEKLLHDLSPDGVIFPVADLEILLR
jgi:hypothetical protein